MSQPNLQTVRLLVEGLTATKFSSLSSLAFLLFDHIITLDSEASYVWQREWSSGKILFLFNRYFGLFILLFDVIVLFSGAVTDDVCKKFLRWEILASIIALVTTGSILALRVHAVYDCNWRVTSVIIFALFSATLSSILIDYIGIPDTAALPLGLTGCYLFNIPAFYVYTWIPPLLCETVQCSFMLYRAWTLYREKRDFPLLTLIVRDSFLYYLTVFSVLLVNCLVWATAPHTLSEVAIGWGVAIPCTMGSRLLLNIRERYLKEETMLTTTTTDLSFMQNPQKGHGRQAAKMLAFTTVPGEYSSHATTSTV